MSLLSLITGSQDLQQLIITNTSNDILCLQFIFVNGSTINEVHLHLQCDHRFFFDNEDLSRNNQLIFTKCFSDIPSGNNWTLYVCDGTLPQGNKICSNPAVILTDISITGRISIKPSRTFTVISTSIIDSISKYNCYYYKPYLYYVCKNVILVYGYCIQLYYIVHSINTTTTTVKNICEDLIIGSLVNFIYYI